MICTMRCLGAEEQWSSWQAKRALLHRGDGSKACNGSMIVESFAGKDTVKVSVWYCSAWVRTCALFLEERLECSRVLKYDVEAEHLSTRLANGQEKGHNRTRDLDTESLLEHLPALQQLLYRLVGYQVLKESFKIDCAINDGIIIWWTSFLRCHGMKPSKPLIFIEELDNSLQNSFLATKEEYTRDAPRVVPIASEAGALMPGILDWFGWCTWDAFYTDVNPEGICQGLQSLA